MEQKKIQNCAACLQTKQKRAAAAAILIAESQNITIHADIYGVMSVPKFSGKKYFLYMIKAPPRYLKVHLIAKCCAVHENFVEFIAWLDRNARQKVRSVHAYNAAEVLALKKP